VVTVVIAILASVAIPRFREVLVRAHVNSIVADGKNLHSAFLEFYSDNYMYPNATSDPFFNLQTFEPLRSMGYYDGDMTDRLENEQAAGYDSPDDQGINQEFWVLLNVGMDPSYQVVVADTDDAPLGDGWMNGVYTFQDGELISGPGADSGG